MILCMNANAAIDKTVVIPGFHLNGIQRPERMLALAGGKGVNCARGLKHLGETPVVTGWAGGFSGQFIAAGLRAEGIATAFVPVEHESRTCLSILDPAGGTLTEIYEQGEPVPPEKVAELKAMFAAVVGQYAAVTFSGSLPPGVPASFYGELLEIARAAGVPGLLDSSGAALRQGLDLGRPALVKPNASEFTAIAGRELAGAAEIAAAADEIARRRQTIVVVSLGADGALAADGGAVLHARPPRLEIKSAVGSGDCTLAGLTYGLTHGFALAESLRYGVAAGTANALSVGAGSFTREDFERVLADVTVVTL